MRARGRIGVVAVSIMLPGDLAWVLDMLGFNWPNVDEDQLRAAASDHRRLAAQVGQAASGGAAGAGAVTAKNTGSSVHAFASHWGEVSASHLDRLAQVYDLTAGTQDVMAGVVEGAKAAVIAQLIALAGEIAAAAAGSVLTFGLSDAAGLAATALTRITVREILDDLERQLIVVAGQLLAGEAVQALSASIGNLVSQGVADYVGTGHGVSIGQAAGAGVAASRQGVAGLGGTGTSQVAAGLGVGTIAGLAHGDAA